MKKTINLKEMPKPWYFTLLILFMVPLAGMGIDVYVPSLPTITTIFNTTANLTKLTLPLYLFGYAIGPLLFGVLSDAYGRKKILLYGLIFYIISCLLIVVFINIWFMLVMRFIQGFTVAAVAATFRAMVTDSYKAGNEMHKMASITVTVWAIGPIVAPFIGAYLQHYFGWQANFIFLMIYAMVIVISMLIIPETNTQPVALQWSTMLANYRTVIAHRVFWSGIIYMGVMYSMIVIFNIVAPFLIQTTLNYSVVQFGHIALLMGFAFFLGGIINRFLVEKFTAQFLILTSLSIVFTISIVMLLLGLFFPVNLYHYIIPVWLILFFSAPLLPAGMAKSMSLFPQMAGLANAVMGFSFITFTGIATVVASLFVSVNQIASAISYLVLIALCFLAYMLLHK